MFDCCMYWLTSERDMMCFTWYMVVGDIFVWCCGRSVLDERAQALPEERGEQLRHQHQDDGRDPQRDGHLARQEPEAEGV